MLGLFCAGNARNDEEYGKTGSFWEVKINEHMISTYAGVGSGIMTAAVVLWIRFQLILKNPKS